MLAALAVIPPALSPAYRVRAADEVKHDSTDDFLDTTRYSGAFAVGITGFTIGPVRSIAASSVTDDARFGPRDRFLQAPPPTPSRIRLRVRPARSATP